MRLVVAVENHLAVACERGSEGFPEGLEAGIVGYNVAIVAAEVVGVDDGVGPFCVGYVVYD